jgi:hypothetical protein
LGQHGASLCRRDALSVPAEFVTGAGIGVELAR